MTILFKESAIKMANYRGSLLALFLHFCLFLQTSNACFGGAKVDSSSGEGGVPDLIEPVSEEKGREYLQQFGYVEPSKLGSQGMTDDVGNVLSSAVGKFQEFAGLPRTGIMDIRTRKKMAAPRCGMLDFQNIGGFSGWKKPHVTYYIENYSRDLPRQLQNEAIRRAFELWSEQVPLDFSETSDFSSADIKVKFASGSHGDPWPFDGRGGVLAHATFPPSGMLHFDESENWVYMDAERLETRRFTDLYIVAIHEIGHTLGLEHSRSKTAIMAPFYQEMVDSNGRYIMPVLKSDDIRAAQSIYGPRRDGGSFGGNGGRRSRPPPPPREEDDDDGTSSGGGPTSAGNSDPFGDFDAEFDAQFGGGGPFGGGFGGGRRHRFGGGRNRWGGRGWRRDDPLEEESELNALERPLGRVERSAGLFRCPKDVNAVSIIGKPKSITSFLDCP